MIYVDVSQVGRFLKSGKPVTGIQRLTLLSLVGLNQLLGESGVAALFFDDALGQFHQMSCADFVSGARGVVAKFKANDKLLFMEWYWNQRVFEATLTAGKAEGAKHFRFLHDVIPLARPEFVRPENARRFRINTERAVAAADVVLTNSDYSKSDILKHVVAAAQRPIEVVKLAHEFAIVGPQGAITSVDAKTNIDGDNVRPEILALKGEIFSLMVGTLEERKNTLLAVKAWQKLFGGNASGQAKLVLVGSFSAHSLVYTAALWLRLKLGRNVIHMRQCSDWELAWLYQHCAFTLYISQYEGWGLPIGESLWFGKRVVTQRVTSLAEAGGGAADYVDAQDDAAFGQLLQKLRVEPTPSAATKLVHWSEFAVKLKQTLDDCLFI